MGLRCASCGYDNDPTRVYCHNCGQRLNRDSVMTPPPTGFTHPTEVAATHKPRPTVAWGRSFVALARLLVLVGLIAVLVLAFVPPKDVPSPSVPDSDLAMRLSGLVADSSMASGARAFGVPAADLNTWLVSSVAFEQPSSPMALRPVRVYAVPGEGVLRVGLECLLPFGFPIYFEGLYAPEKRAGRYRLDARHLSLGRLPLPSFAGLLVSRQFDGLAASLSGPLEDITRASFIGITPQTVTLQWSGETP